MGFTWFLFSFTRGDTWRESAMLLSQPATYAEVRAGVSFEAWSSNFSSKNFLERVIRARLLVLRFPEIIHRVMSLVNEKTQNKCDFNSVILSCPSVKGNSWTSSWGRAECVIWNLLKYHSVSVHIWESSRRSEYSKRQEKQIPKRSINTMLIVIGFLCIYFSYIIKHCKCLDYFMLWLYKVEFCRNRETLSAGQGH